MINQETVNKILERVEIVDIIQDFIHLKRRGVNFLGLCPFHNEKTPSFTVSPSKGIYKCFGCGKAGNAVNFIMEHEQMQYPEALRYLAKKYQIDIVETEQTAEQIEQKNTRESMLIVTNYAQKYFTGVLHNDKEGIAVGLSYFKERGFSKETIEKFQLGYCTEEKDKFTQEAIRNGYKLEYLVSTGLTIDKNNYRFDRFAGRVIFPIHGISGNTIAFGARILKTDTKTAKYLNSPESEIYHKSNILYGIYFAKREIIKYDKCFMVEGYTDVISLHQAGIENVVASSGTSLTQNQIILVKRFTENLTILYDGDSAGIKASFRGIDLVLEQGMNVKVVLFPDGEDPDSFSKKMNKSELKEFIENNEKDFIKFKTDLLLQEAKSDPVKKSNLVNDIVKSISLIPDAIKRSIYIKECSNILNIKEDALYTEANKLILRNREEQRKTEFTNVKSQTFEARNNALPGFIENVYSEVNEKELISILLHYADKELFTEENGDVFEKKTTTVAEYIIKEILNDELEFKNLVYKEIFEDYKKHFEEGNIIDNKFFINHIDEKIRVLAANLLSQTYKESAIWTAGGKKYDSPEATLKKDVPKAVNTYKLKIIQLAIKDYELSLKKIEKEDIDEVKNLLEQLMRLHQTKSKLADEIGKRTIL
ncbi:MAG: DNA primase [Bacteroidales bacterium]|nr:DNA primase [Bacteroidales bacterium]MBN2757770.1 DNA primase [Bacteroidales bacterium]